MTNSTVRTVLASLMIGFVGTGCVDLLDDPVDYGVVEVFATRRSGEPVPDAWLLLYTGLRDVDVGTTDENGVHRFAFVPPQSYGVFAAPPPGYVRPEDVLGGPTTERVDKIGIEEGSEAEVSFTYLKVGPGTVEVVLTEPDGSGVEDVLVDLYTAQAWLRDGRTDQDGRVTFTGAPFGIVAVAAYPPAIYLDEGQDRIVRQSILIEDGTHELITVTLEPCVGSIATTVVDSSGAAVGGVALDLYRPSGYAASGTTGPDGAYTFASVECRVPYGVRVFPPPGYSAPEGRGSSYFDGIELARGERVEVRFILTPD